MSSVNPILEHIFNTNIIIPGIEDYTQISPTFFFIICQNEGIAGRNELPDKMKIKTRKIIYPNQNEEEVENICSQINSALYIGDPQEKDQLPEKEARFCGRFMLRVNEKGILPQRWSLRDISKIFMRIKNQRINEMYYINISTEINLIFYALSSISKDEERAKAEKLSELISQVFQCEEKKENIMKTYLEEPQLDKDFSIVGETQSIKYSICKNESKIQIGKIDINDEEEDKEYKSYELMRKLKSLMNTLFKMKLANNDEPLLL